MEYSINPEEHQLKKARVKIEEIIDSYSYSIDVENVELNLGWQQVEGTSSVIHEEGSRLTLIINPDADMEELEKNVLRGLLEIEFLRKAPFEEYNFNWQEILKLGYVTNKLEHLIQSDIQRDKELNEEWPEFKELLSKETGEFTGQFYMNASALGETIGKKLLENHEIEELPELKKSDVVEAGDSVFSG